MRELRRTCADHGFSNMRIHEVRQKVHVFFFEKKLGTTPNSIWALKLLRSVFWRKEVGYSM